MIRSKCKRSQRYWEAEARRKTVYFGRAQDEPGTPGGSRRRGFCHQDGASVCQRADSQNLHFRALNAHIDLAGTCLALANAPLAWPRSDRPRIAGVSGFGLGGTNAHIVMAEAPAAAIPQSVPADVLPFLISGKTESALKAQAAQLAQHLSQHEGCHRTRCCVCAICRRSH